MAVFDVLNTDAADANLSFVGNNAVLETRITYGPGGAIPLINGNSLQTFQDGDNILLKKIRIIRPFQYGRGNYATARYVIGFDFLQNGAGVAIPELGENGAIYLNSVCGDLEPEIRLQAPAPGAGDFELRLTWIDIVFSQIGGPAVLNLQDLFFGVQVEIKHTVFMV